MNKPLLELKSAIKTYTLDQDKVITPEETLNKAYDVLARCHLDIFKEFVPINILDIPLYFAKGGVDYVNTVHAEHSSGKGFTHKQAQASGLMELIERFSAFSYKYELLHTYSEIKDKVPDFKRFFPLLTHMPDEAKIITELADIPLHWSYAYNLTKQQNTLIPQIYQDIVWSNGLAAGNTIEEAILQGICEIIERHVVSNIELNKIETPTITPDSIQNPMAIELINKFKDTNMEIILKDFTLEMEIPTIGAIGYYKAGEKLVDDYEWRMIVAGTHTDPLKALLRALTELVQALKSFLHLKKDKQEKLLKFVDEGIIKSGILTKKAISYIENSSQQTNFDEIKNYAKHDIKDEIEMCVNILAQKGIEILVVDMTHSELHIPVVRVAGLNSLLNAPETNISIYFLQGVCYQRIGQFDKAIEAFIKAQKKEPDFYQAYNSLGVCYYNIYKQNENIEYLDLAIENFKRSIDLLPTRAIDFFNLASMLFNKGNREEAKTFFNKALKLDQNYKFTKLYQKFI